MKVAKISIYIIIVSLFLLNTTAAYSITIEEFIEKHPDAGVAFNADYYTNGYDKSSTWSSGLMDDDPYALSKGNVIYFRDLYKSGIVKNSILIELIRKTDNSIDLMNVSINRGNTNLNSRTYCEKFDAQELVLIPNATGYQIIEVFFDVKYDGNNLSYIKVQNPNFRLQLSLTNDLHLDTVEDGEKRIKGIDPTPPIYGDVE